MNTPLFATVSLLLYLSAFFLYDLRLLPVYPMAKRGENENKTEKTREESMVDTRRYVGRECTESEATDERKRRRTSEAQHGMLTWEEAKIVGTESGQIQRKMLEGVETMKQKERGRNHRTPLNNQMDQLQTTVYSFLDES